MNHVKNEHQDNTKRKLAMLAPVTPFRSGVAKHSTMLAIAIADQCEHFQVFSFSRQYPAFLFPGESDVEPDGAPPGRLRVNFSIDSVNPLSWQKTARQIIQFDPEILVIPTWTFFLAPCQQFIANRCRRSGIHIRIFCHNVFDHDSTGWRQWMNERLLNCADSFVTHTTEMADQIVKVRPDARVSVHPHPIFDQFPDATEKLPRKADLELLFFGLIRPYKGLSVALQALADLKSLSIHMRVVGEFWGGLESTQSAIQELGIQDRVEIVAGYASDEAAANYFTRCDAVVLPYKSATGSGIVPLAYRFNKPVIVSDLPGLVSVVRANETGWIVPAGDAGALARTIRDHVTAGNCAAMQPGIEDLKKSMSWNSLAKLVIS